MDFPVAAVETLIRLLREGLASGNVPSYLAANWQPATSALIELVQWVLAVDKNVVTADGVPDVDQYASTLAGLVAGANGMLAVTLGPGMWIVIVKLILELLANAKQQVQ